MFKLKNRIRQNKSILDDSIQNGQQLLFVFTASKNP